MKILYLANIRLPSENADALQVAKMCEAFADRGYHVELVVPKRKNAQFNKQDVFEYYNLKTKFKITRLWALDLMAWRKNLGHLAFKALYWSFARLASIYARLAMADVIYSRDWRVLQLLRRGKNNLIFELHEFRDKDVWAYKSIEPACLKIVVISRGLQQKLVAAGIMESKIILAPDAVDPAEFNFHLTPPKAREAVNLPPDGQLLVYTGNLYEWKGIYTLIKAFKLLQENPRYQAAERQGSPLSPRLVLVGGKTEDTQAVKDYLIEHDVNGVVVVGHRPYTEVPLYLKAADLLLIGDSAQYAISREDTSPLKLFQYMAARRPIVAAATPAIREILNPENSWLFAPDNPQSLALVLASALESPQESDKKVKRAYQDMEMHTWERRAEKIFFRLKI